jgi:hypothetical protein
LIVPLRQNHVIPPPCRAQFFQSRDTFLETSVFNSVSCAGVTSTADFSIPHTSVALTEDSLFKITQPLRAAAAAAAVSSMASIEAMGFHMDQQQHAKLEKGANVSEGSPKYISL